ncbi:hypothetical protein HYH03_016803 [Edaphochlamys debaryana]|uniref:Uncharacterized protein n=1 Tax=Edaphochlamys debaryana TaxID=47281 RepID=A0A835XKB0_9CHLO|nr:hypothetical protein HYH03_016803 [Edaphochlamys debaryana]|eukprot:KAG2484388.1 hypothetical protein HYH03_016803 [Edaphochlamys debaryana]
MLTAKQFVVVQLVCSDWSRAARCCLKDATPKRPDVDLSKLVTLYPNLTHLNLLHVEGLSARMLTPLRHLTALRELCLSNVALQLQHAATEGAAGDGAPPAGVRSAAPAGEALYTESVAAAGPAGSGPCTRGAQQRQQQQQARPRTRSRARAASGGSPDGLPPLPPGRQARLAAGGGSGAGRSPAAGSPPPTSQQRPRSGRGTADSAAAASAPSEGGGEGAAQGAAEVVSSPPPSPSNRIFGGLGQVLQRLQKLQADLCPALTAEALACLPSLTDLTVDALVTPEALAPLARLRCLAVKKLANAEALEGLSRLAGLTALLINSDSSCAAEFLPVCARLPDLQALTFKTSSTKLLQPPDGVCWAGFSRLTSLDLRAPVECLKPGLPALAELRGLKALSLDLYCATDEELMVTVVAPPGLESLFVSSDRSRSGGVIDVHPNPKLRSLRIRLYWTALNLVLPEGLPEPSPLPEPDPEEWEPYPDPDVPLPRTTALNTPATGELPGAGEARPTGTTDAMAQDGDGDGEDGGATGGRSGRRGHVRSASPSPHGGDAGGSPAVRRRTVSRCGPGASTGAAGPSSAGAGPSSPTARRAEAGNGGEEPARTPPSAATRGGEVEAGGSGRVPASGGSAGVPRRRSGRRSDAAVPSSGGGAADSAAAGAGPGASVPDTPPSDRRRRANACTSAAATPAAAGGGAGSAPAYATPVGSDAAADATASGLASGGTTAGGSCGLPDMQLQELCLDACFFLLYGSLVPVLKQFPRLRTLTLDNCLALENGELAQLCELASLTEVSLAGVHLVTDTGLRALGRLPSLAQLRLKGLRKLAVHAAQAYMRQKPIVRRYEDVSGAFLTSLASLPDLRCLALKHLHTASGGHLAAGLSALTQLTRLEVKDVHAMSDTVLTSVSRHRSLQELSVLHCEAVTARGRACVVRGLGLRVALDFEGCSLPDITRPLCALPTASTQAQLIDDDRVSSSARPRRSCQHSNQDG